MAKRKIKPTDVTPESKRVGSEVGFKLNEQSRKAALESIDSVTEKRETDGWVWMQKDRATKQVKPENIQKNIDDGWKIKQKPKN